MPTQGLFEDELKRLLPVKEIISFFFTNRYLKRNKVFYTMTSILCCMYAYFLVPVPVTYQYPHH